MYSHWTCITKRDLIQKGASYSKLSSNLNVEKIVLNMTLPTVGSSLPTAGNRVGSIPDKRSTGKLNQLKGSESLQLKASSNVDRESVLNLSAMSLLAVISGQRPQLTKARKSIANWKVRKNQVLGFKVTLRGKFVYEFLDKTIRFHNLSESPYSLLKSRVKSKLSISEDLGLSTTEYSLQGLGNLSIGIKNINLYPELEDLWIANTLSKKIGFDLSLNFKNSKELLKLISSLKRIPGGKRLSSVGLKAFPSVSKPVDEVSGSLSSNNSQGLFCTETKTKLLSDNKFSFFSREAILALKHLILLRKLYLTSIGLFPA